MSSIFILVLLSSALYIQYIDTDVVIQNTGGVANQAVSECGKSLTLTCTFKNILFIVWKNEKDILPIAKCTPFSCTINPAYYGQYSISFDRKRRVFDLTIEQVTMKDNGRKLVCSDGSHSDSKIIFVRDYNIDFIVKRNFGTILAASGCVSRDKHVSFKWMKIDACSSIESEFVPNVLFKNTTSCSNDHVCGNDQHIQYIQEVKVSSSDNGNYLLKVVAVYGIESKLSEEIVVRNITLKGEKHACDLQDKRSTGYIIYIAAASGFGMILLLLFIMKRAKLVSYILRKISGKTTEPCKNQRDNVDDEVVYLAIQTAEGAANEIQEEEEN